MILVTVVLMGETSGGKNQKSLGFVLLKRISNNRFEFTQLIKPGSV
jgi:hypothetical protein